MTVTSKHEFHPDAESLNAFAEEALGPKERGEIVAHLAECGRCREIVFLAQEAAVAMEMEMVPQLAVAAAAPRPDSDSGEKRWFKSWRLAWVPVGALAVVVTVAYVVHLRHGEMNSDVAKVERARLPQNQRTAVAPPAAPVVSQPPAGGGHAETAEKKIREGEAGPALKSKSLSGVPNVEEANRQLSSIGNAAAVPEVAPAPPLPETASGMTSMPMTNAAQKELQQDEITMQAVRGAPMVTRREEAGDEARRKVAGGSLAATATAPKPDTNAKTSGGSMVAGRSLSAGAFGANKPKAIDLPSGLGAVSTAGGNHHTVAIDAAGAVFVSDDPDGQWEAVAKQWSGQATKVRLQASAGTNSLAGAVPAAFFEMVNDEGKVWVSTNGRIWNPK